MKSMSNRLGADNTEQGVRNLLARVTLNRRFLSSSIDESIQRQGLDSVGIIELMSALEREFGIYLSEADVIPKNFKSIRAIAQLVEKKNATA